MVIYDINNEEFVDSVEIEMSAEDFESYFGRLVELYNMPAAVNDEFWGDEDNPDMEETSIETIYQMESNLKDMSPKLREQLYRYENSKSEKKRGISGLLDFFKRN